MKIGHLRNSLEDLFRQRRVSRDLGSRYSIYIEIIKWDSSIISSTTIEKDCVCETDFGMVFQIDAPTSLRRVLVWSQFSLYSSEISEMIV